MEDVVSPREVGHDSHVEDPFKEENVPKRHGSQSSDPADEEYHPTSQDSHTTEPSFVE